MTAGADAGADAVGCGELSAGADAAGADCGAAIACRTAGADETRRLGAAVAGAAEAGDVIVLVGDLGAGKTAFVQGFAAALGVTAPVTSPTFTLANRYQGRLVVNHLDVYRFDDPAEAHDLALPELIDEGVTLVEWGDTILPMLPAEHLTVTIRFASAGGGAGDDERRLDLRGRGEPWRSRWPGLKAALGAWQQPC